MTTYTAQYPPSHDSTYVVATTYLGTSYYPHFATDPSLSLTGSYANTSWITTSAYAPQKLNIDLGEEKIIRRLYIENGHFWGSEVTGGIKNVSVYGTNSATAFANTTYADTTDLTLIGTIEVQQHAAVDASDPQYFLLDNDTAYQYYVFCIADNWRAASYSMLRHLELQTEDGYSGGGGEAELQAYRGYLETPWLDSDPVRNHLETVWEYEFTPFRNHLETITRYAFISNLRTPWRAGQLYRNHLTTPWRGAYVVRNNLRTPFIGGVVCRAHLSTPWVGLEPYRGYLTAPFGVVEGAYRGHLETVFDVKEFDVYRNHLQAVWFGGGKSVDQQYEVTVSFGGESISPAQINIRRSRSEYVIECKLAMAGDPDELVGERLPKRKYAYLTDAEQDAARDAAAVVVTITINGEVVETVQLLATSISFSETVDGSDYTIVAESEAVLLDAPYARPVTDEYGPGLVGELMAALAGEYPVSFAWDAVDWRIPGGVLYGNAEVPIDIIRKPKEAIGGMIQSGLDGSVAVLPYYPVSKKDWSTAEPAEIFEVGENLWSHARDDDDRTDYNSFLVGDTLSSSASLNYETIDVSYGIKQIRAYEVPWTGVNPGLDTSGPDRVIIEAGKVVTETITGEQVEIVGGEGRTEHPIYSIIDRDYGENTQLGAISYAEDGTINTEIPEQTIALVSYVTKYWQWRVKDAVEEDVQFFTQPAWSDVAIALVVTFGDAAAASGFVVAEPDAVLNVDDDGEELSELPPGQPFYFTLQHDDTVALESVAVSAGSVAGRGTVSRAKSGRLEFADASAVELPYIPAGDVKIDWYGRSPQISREGRALKAAKFPAIGEAEYTALMQSFALSPPAMSLGEDENYYILITLTMVSV